LGCPVSTPLDRHFLPARGAVSLGAMTALHHRSRTADAAGAAAGGPPLTTPARGPVRVVAPATGTQSWPAPAAASATSDVGSVRITMTAGDEVVTATLADTPAAHPLAAMLPLTVDLQDPFGQAKSRALPHQLAVDGTEREFHPRTGDLLLAGRRRPGGLPSRPRPRRTPARPGPPRHRRQQTGCPRLRR
jgi:Cyclophilin-like family